MKPPNSSTTRLFLWSGPRNISTTLMYSWAQRPDTQVFDEPLYGAYLKETPAKGYHPQAGQVMASMECDARKVVEMMLGAHQKPVVFFKNMTHHLMGLERGFMKSGFNIILTRDPEEMIPSFAKVIPNPTLTDVGYGEQAKLLRHLENERLPFAVLESKKVLLNPGGVLRQLCEKAGIRFYPEMLHWAAGPRPEDGTWAAHWYKSVHNSTGFKPYEPKTAPFPGHLLPLLKECVPFYQELESKALR